MERTPDGNHYILKTGRVIAANRGILGLTPALDELTGGLDEPIEAAPHPDDGPEDLNRRLDPGERREIADHQIALWEQFAEWGLQRAPEEKSDGGER